MMMDGPHELPRLRTSSSVFRWGRKTPVPEDTERGPPSQNRPHVGHQHSGWRAVDMI